MSTQVSAPACGTSLKTSRASAAMNRQFVSPLICALCAAFATAVSEISTPMTSSKDFAALSANSPLPQ